MRCPGQDRSGCGHPGQYDLPVGFGPKAAQGSDGRDLWCAHQRRQVPSGGGPGAMGELEFGKYPRNNAIAKQYLDLWRRACERANDPKEATDSGYRSQSTIESAYNHPLDRHNSKC